MKIPDPPNQKVEDPSTFSGIVIEGISKSFGPKVVLDKTDLLIHKGETLVIIGRSGEGKSVLLKHIVRLLEPDEGQIWCEGTKIHGLKKSKLMEMRKKFGFLFQGAALFDSMNVCKNVGLMMEEHTNLSDEEIKQRACECLGQVGLNNAEDKLPSELSGGMKKRAGLARAIVMEPEYILYDEPTTGLDPILAATIAEVAKVYPAVKDLDIPSRLSDNVTLSTMHGCPP